MKSLVFRAAVWAWSASAVATLAAQPRHLDHAPTAGGAFATVAGDTLHIEAVWSEQRRLRMLVWDATGEPMPLGRLREIEARVTAGKSDSALRFIEADGYFEARIPTLALPARMQIWVKDHATQTEDRLEFTFATYSPDGLGLGLPSPPEIPGTLSGVFTAIDAEMRTVRSSLEREDSLPLTELEGRIREYALAIEPYLAGLPGEKRAVAANALAAVVRSCWRLHLAVDNGYANQRSAAFARLEVALARLRGSMAGVIK